MASACRALTRHNRAGGPDLACAAGGNGGEDRICGELAVPLHAHGVVVGVLGVASGRPGRVLGAAEMELLCRFGEIAGVAIDNAVRLAAARCELAELAQSEARYRTVFEELPTLVYTGDYAIGGSWLYKFSDTAVEVYARSRTPDALSAAVRVSQLLEARN